MTKPKSKASDSTRAPAQASARRTPTAGKKTRKRKARTLHLVVSMDGGALGPEQMRDHAIINGTLAPRVRNFEEIYESEFSAGRCEIWGRPRHPTEEICLLKPAPGVRVGVRAFEQDAGSKEDGLRVFVVLSVVTLFPGNMSREDYQIWFDPSFRPLAEVDLPAVAELTLEEQAEAERIIQFISGRRGWPEMANTTTVQGLTAKTLVRAAGGEPRQKLPHGTYVNIVREVSDANPEIDDKGWDDRPKALIDYLTLVAEGNGQAILNRVLKAFK
jgi:hypothetical protein